MSEPLIFSPTDTQKWLRCPVLRQLEREWEPLGDWQPHMALGSAIARAQEAYYKTRGDAETAWTACETSLIGDFVEQPSWTLEGLCKLAEKGLRVALVECDRILATEHVVAVEEQLGACIPDLVTRHKTTGRLIVTDGKVTLRLDPKYREDRIREYDSNHQFWHNAWAVQQAFGETPEWTRLHLTALSPKAQSLLHPTRVTEERLQFWLTGAERAWEQMARERSGEIEPAPNFESCHGRYGRCRMYEACHVLGRDPVAMANLYERKG